MEPTGTIAGLVQDTDGDRLPGVTVTAAGGEAPRVAISDARGEFRLRPLEPGPYTVTAEFDGFTPDRQMAEVRLGEPTELAITLHIAQVGG